MLPTVSAQVPPAERLHESVVAKTAQDLIKDFAHKPPIVVHDSAEGILPGATAADGVAGAVKDGQILLFRDRLPTTADVERTLFHELFRCGFHKFSPYLTAFILHSLTHAGGFLNDLSIILCDR